MVSPDLLQARPHPLPRAHWLEDSPPGGAVLDVQPAPFSGERRTDWFQWTLPPGATRARLPVMGACSLWVDGELAEIQSGEAILPNPGRSARIATMRVESKGGSGGGGVFEAPVGYTIAAGMLKLGDWTKQGLESYSGGVRYRSSFNLEQPGDCRWMLDLGRVRGTAEAWINGHSAGARFLAPYRFEITDFVLSGKNNIEVLVCNTLAPYLSQCSPTHFAFNNQLASGLFGPVLVLASSPS